MFGPKSPLPPRIYGAVVVALLAAVNVRSDPGTLIPNENPPTVTALGPVFVNVTSSVTLLSPAVAETLWTDITTAALTTLDPRNIAAAALNAIERQ